MKQIINKKTLPIAALLLGAIILPPVLRLNLSVLSILTMALLYMYWSSAWNIMGGYTGLFALGLLLVVLIVSYMISRSKWGFQFRAISANMEAASSLGVPPPS